MNRRNWLRTAAGLLVPAAFPNRVYSFIWAPSRGKMLTEIDDAIREFHERTAIVTRYSGYVVVDVDDLMPRAPMLVGNVTIDGVPV